MCWWGCFENNIALTKGGIMKNHFRSYYRSSFVIFLCAFLLLIGLMALSSSAFALQSGDFTYTDSGITITITKYNGAGGVVAIPADIGGRPVVNIGVGAFINCTGLTSVTIPNSVTNIENYVFQSCTGLTSVAIPSSVMSIGDGAFADCLGLTTAYFYGNAPSMGYRVFYDCSSNFSVCYIAGSTGFTNPTWLGYPTRVCEETTTSTTSTTQPETSTTSISGTTTTTTPATQCPAEAIYGNNSEETELLREYRDKVLSKSATGRQMIKTYYELSPAVAEVLQQNETAKSNARRVLDSLMPAIREKVKQ
jgi:hypothetical protein